MTNAEKYLKAGIKGTDIFNLAQELGEYLTINCGAEQVFVSDINIFFQRKVKPTLTEDERVILRNIVYDSEYKYIYRSLGMLYLSENEKLTCLDRLPAMHHLFQFIKERRRI